MTTPRTLAQLAGTITAAAALACASSPSGGDPTAGEPQAATIAAATDRFVTVRDARLRYRIAGRGQPVVLLHGLTRTLDEWVGVGDSLARDHRVIALDLRGHGQSTRFTDPKDFGVNFVDDVAGLLDSLRIARAHLVGHSLGAAIAAKMATRHPGRVASLSLIAGGFSNDTSSLDRNQAGFIADIEQGRGLTRFIQWLFPGAPDSVAAALSTEVLATNEPPTIVAAMRSTDALRLTPELSDMIRAPAVIAVGTGDPLLSNSRWLASWWPEAQLIVADDANHLTILHQPEVLAAMRQLIRREALR